MSDTQASEPLELGAALNELRCFIDRFMWFPASHQLDAVTLWIAHTHAVEVLDVCAYLHISSPEKGSGKSLLLDLMEPLVSQGRSTASISPAALYRMVDRDHPTLLIDEIDTIFTKGRNGDPARAELAGLINAGYRRGRLTYRMGGPNFREVETFDAFGPKALAGIGDSLPDTTADRCVRIRLQRKARDAATERYRLRVDEPTAKEIGRRLELAVRAVICRIGHDWPALPEELNNRQQEIWEPLFVIAAAAGGDWPSRCGVAAVALHAAADPIESINIRLLADIRCVFDEERMLTKILVERLNGLDESPWSEWRHGQGITSAWLAERLRQFGIKSKPMRADIDRGRGFERHSFDPVFDRYLASPATDDDEEPDVTTAAVTSMTAVDTVDTCPSPQTSGVNTFAATGVDATVDSPVPGHAGPMGEVTVPSTVVNGVYNNVPGMTIDAEEGLWTFQRS